ncbi:MAG: hypothetical protein GY750_15790 [Lentisphaerae bacterium]|nr:hypothetical protein [Lentisphaerota bacterium]MCP4102860.1 hypothetical protein [Lentisphaerota bacterium]
MRTVIFMLLILSVPFGLKAKSSDKENKETASKHSIQHTAKMLRMLPAISNEEKDKLRKLYQTDPQAFRKEIRRLVDVYKKKKHQETKKLKKLAYKYQNAKSSADKQKYYDEIYAITRKIFEEQMIRYKKRLEALEKQLKRLTAKYEQRQQGAEKIIKARVDYLTRNRKLDWEGN